MDGGGIDLRIRSVGAGLRVGARVPSMAALGGLLSGHQRFDPGWVTNLSDLSIRMLSESRGYGARAWFSLLATT
jgi:hypothetical protein